MEIALKRKKKGEQKVNGVRNRTKIIIVDTPLFTSVDYSCLTIRITNSQFINLASPDFPVNIREFNVRYLIVDQRLIRHTDRRRSAGA